MDSSKFIDGDGNMWFRAMNTSNGAENVIQAQKAIRNKKDHYLLEYLTAEFIVHHLKPLTFSSGDHLGFKIKDLGPIVGDRDSLVLVYDYIIHDSERVISLLEENGFDVEISEKEVETMPFEHTIGHFWWKKTIPSAKTMEKQLKISINESQLEALED